MNNVLFWVRNFLEPSDNYVSLMQICIIYFQIFFSDNSWYECVNYKTVLKQYILLRISWVRAVFEVNEG